MESHRYLSPYEESIQNAAPAPVLATFEDVPMEGGAFLEMQLKSSIEKKQSRKRRRRRKPTRSHYLTRSAILLGLSLVVAGIVFIVLSVNKKESSNGGYAQQQTPTNTPSYYVPTDVETTISPLAQLLIDFLVLNSITSVQELLDASSPQRRAVAFLASTRNNPHMDLVTNIVSDSTKEGNYKLLERYALSVFYFSTGGDVDWTQPYHFLDPALDACAWNDVSPPGVVGGRGGAACIDNKVVNIQLSKSNEKLAQTSKPPIVPFSR